MQNIQLVTVYEQYGSIKRNAFVMKLLTNILTVASVQFLEIFPQQPLIAAELYFKMQRSSSH